jgi:hypothetical protein
MTTNRPKKTADWHNWMRLTQFIIFCVSCVAAVIIWHYSLQSQQSEMLETKYVTKTELALIEQKLNSVETSLNKLEKTNREVVNLITDIRLALARRSN